MDIAGCHRRFSNELYCHIRLDSQDQLPHLDIDTFKVLVRIREGIHSRQPHSRPMLPQNMLSFSSFEFPFHSFFNEIRVLLRSELSHPDIPHECADDIVLEAMNLARCVMYDTRRFVFNLSPKAVLLAIDIVFESPPPAASELVQKVKFEGGDGTEICSICFVEFNKDEELSATPCQHVYHEECIVKWLEKGSMCPLCRHPMESD